MNRTSTLRLRSVRMKAGGAAIRVLSNDTPRVVSANLREVSGAIASDHASDIVGYALVAWHIDGGTSTQVFIGEGRIVPRFKTADFVKTAVTDFLTAPESEE